MSASQGGNVNEQSRLLGLGQTAESCRNLCRLTVVRQDGVFDRGRPTIMQKPRARSYSPKGRRSPVFAPGTPLSDTIIQSGSHVVKQQV